MSKSFPTSITAKFTLARINAIFVTKCDQIAELYYDDEGGLQGDADDCLAMMLENLEILHSMRKRLTAGASGVLSCDEIKTIFQDVKKFEPNGAATFSDDEYMCSE